MSSEKNNIVRLATLKTPRDLSLGGSTGVTRGGAVRRKFTPNIAAAASAKATQKETPGTVEVNLEKKAGKKKDKSFNKKGPRDRKHKNDLFVQKSSIFDTMPMTDVKNKAPRSSYGYSSSSLRTSSSSSSLRTSKIKIKSENKMETEDNDGDGEEEEEDKEIVQKLITHSLIDDEEDEEEEDEGSMQPLCLPLEGNVKKSFEMEADVKPALKVETAAEDMDVSSSAFLDDTTKHIKQEHPSDSSAPPPPNKTHSSTHFSRGDIYLVQLPSILPGNPPMTDKEVNDINNNKNNNKTQKTEETPKKNRCLKDFSEGLIGTLRVQKAGEMRLNIGKVTFKCFHVPQTQCRQELGLVAPGSRRGPYESLYRFGRVSKSLVLYPDLQDPSAFDSEEDNNSNNNDDDDESEEEYKVYLCKPDDRALYLFNLPLTYGLEHIRSGRLKPLCGLVQFDLEDWPTRENDEELRPLMVSSGCNILPKVFAVGVFNDRQLHLTPLCDIVKMRPDFKSFKAKDDDVVSDVEDDKESKEAQVVNAHMKIKESESVKNKRLASFQHMQSEERKEAWQELRFIDPTEFYKESALLSSTTQACELNMPWEDYVDELTRDTVPCENVETSLGNLHRLKLPEQVKWLVERCKAIDFPQLTSLLPPSTAPSDIIGYLEQYAVLIQGCWVVKSESIISASNQTGVALRALRDFVLYKFSQREGVTKAQLSSLHRLRDEDEAVILGGISKQDKALKKKVFILDANEAFMKKHDQVVKRQNLLLKQKFEQIKLILPFKNADAPATHKQPHVKKS